MRVGYSDIGISGIIPGPGLFRVDCSRWVVLALDVALVSE